MSSGYGTYRPAARAIAQKTVELENNRRNSGHWSLCWRCQKDRPIYGGSIKFFGSVRRFICKGCIDARSGIAKVEGGAA